MASNIKISCIVSCFKGERYLPAFLENCASQSIKNITEIILVHNEPSQEEVAIVKDFQNRNPDFINHVVIAREPLAVSMNRAIKAAAGEYVCIWNIDDLRTENSLELQLKTLEENSEVGFTYGDFIIVSSWLSQQGRLIKTPEFNKQSFIASFPEGPFPMWRKKLNEKHGYFDEQCLQGADYELFARFSVESIGKKTYGLLGYYLDEGLGLSTRAATLQPIERTFIELRYGAFQKIDFRYLLKAQKYNIEQVLENGVWKNINAFSPNRKKFLNSKAWLIYAFLSYPIRVFVAVTNKLKRKFLWT